MMYERGSPARCFMTPPPLPPSSWKSRVTGSPTVPFSERKKSPSSVNKSDLFHIIHKVPAGDSPYVKAKQVQLVDKDPAKAISLFWAAINAGDRVESALKDMALVMKQLDRSDEAIEAIRSFRNLCPSDSQDSLDNILVELYKRSGRVDEEIAMLHHKLKQIEDGITFVGRTTKQARSQGKKIQITAEQEISRILGNLAWAYLQKEDYQTAEEHYRKALSFEVDRNKQCNLAICLMHLNRIKEAKFLLQAVTTATRNRKMDDSFVKSYERASQMLAETESSENKAFPMTGISHCSPQSFENSSVKSSDSVKSRTEYRSVTSERDASHARRRLYQSPDPGRRDLNVPCTKPKRCSWGFNNGYRRETWGDTHSDSKPSFGTPPSDKHVTMLQNSREHGLPSPANGKWRTLEDPPILKLEDTTVTSSDSSHTLNTETAMEFSEKEKSGAGDSSYSSTLSESHVMAVNGANESALGNGKPLEKKSWADIVEEEQNEENDFFSEYTYFDGDAAEVFNDENEDSNIMYQCPWPQNQTENSTTRLESVNQKEEYNNASGNGILSRNPTARRSLCFNPELSPEPNYFICASKSLNKASNFESCRIMAKERDSLTEEKKLKRRNRLQVFQDITLLPGNP